MAAFTKLLGLAAALTLFLTIETEAAVKKPANSQKNNTTSQQNQSNSNQENSNQNASATNNGDVNQNQSQNQGQNASNQNAGAEGNVNNEANAQQNSQNNATNGEDEDWAEDAPEEDNQSFFYDSRRNPHPRFPSSHATKRLILTFQKPKEDKLNLCVKEFRAAADTATNADSMVQSMKLMAAAVSRNVKFYHWCFYHFISALDWKLEEDSLGLQLQDKMTIFTKNMKGLWLLARALDESVDSHIYFDFIKVRYIELSMAHFGRNLEVISPPLGDPRWIEPTKYFRPAGAFDK